MSKNYEIYKNYRSNYSKQAVPQAKLLVKLNEIRATSCLNYVEPTLAYPLARSVHQDTKTLTITKDKKTTPTGKQQLMVNTHLSPTNCCLVLKVRNESRKQIWADFE